MKTYLNNESSVIMSSFSCDKMKQVFINYHSSTKIFLIKCTECFYMISRTSKYEYTPYLYSNETALNALIFLAFFCSLHC